MVAAAVLGATSVVVDVVGVALAGTAVVLAGTVGDVAAVVGAVVATTEVTQGSVPVGAFVRGSAGGGVTVAGTMAAGSGLETRKALKTSSAAMTASNA